MLAERTAEQQAALAELVARRTSSSVPRRDRQALLDELRGERHEAEEDVEELEQASAELAARIRAAQGTGSASSGSGAAPASGFVWPVDGPITSPFGLRWGRLHAGIDIGVGFGTPIRAAAAGTVIHAGWLGGYGNLVVVDHGGGLSTAYGHQQRIYVSVGPAGRPGHGARRGGLAPVTRSGPTSISRSASTAPRRPARLPVGAGTHGSPRTPPSRFRVSRGEASGPARDAGRPAT